MQVKKSGFATASAVRATSALLDKMNLEQRSTTGCTGTHPIDDTGENPRHTSNPLKCSIMCRSNERPNTIRHIRRLLILLTIPLTREGAVSIIPPLSRGGAVW